MATENKLVKYEILVAYELGELVEEVETAIERGWEPLGAPFKDVVYYQAIIKKEPVATKSTRAGATAKKKVAKKASGRKSIATSSHSEEQSE